MSSCVWSFAVFHYTNMFKNYFPVIQNCATFMCSCSEYFPRSQPKGLMHSYPMKRLFPLEKQSDPQGTKFNGMVLGIIHSIQFVSMPYGLYTNHLYLHIKEKCQNIKSNNKIPRFVQRILHAFEVPIFIQKQQSIFHICIERVIKYQGKQGKSYDVIFTKHTSSIFSQCSFSIQNPSLHEIQQIVQLSNDEHNYS